MCNKNTDNLLSSPWRVFSSLKCLTSVFGMVTGVIHFAIVTSVFITNILNKKSQVIQQINFNIIINKKNLYTFMFEVFFWQSEKYGGKGQSWEFSSAGFFLKENLKNLWRDWFIIQEKNNHEYESSILTIPEILKASGHLKSFFDWAVECKKCSKNFRLDSLLSDKEKKDFFCLKEYQKEDFEASFICSSCKFKNCSKIFRFPLLAEAKFGFNSFFLRPETCQTLFSSFFLVKRRIRCSLPFGIGQIGKSFRHEISNRHGLFKTREFEQMELEFFCQEESEKWWKYWTNQARMFFRSLIINNPQRIKISSIEAEERPHYSKKTEDINFLFSFGYGEIASQSDRGNYDLNQHFSSEKNNPNVIEVSFGLERTMLAILEDSQKENSDTLYLSPLICPYFVTIVSLNKKLQNISSELYFFLNSKRKLPFRIGLETSKSVGKAYHHQDSLGTYFCLTVDNQFLNDETVTIRFRDTKKQERIEKKRIISWLLEKYEEFYSVFIQNKQKKFDW